MDIEEIKDKARFMHENRITVHVDTKDKSFFNGLIIEFHETFIVINDHVVGLAPVSFSEINKINLYKER